MNKYRHLLSLLPVALALAASMIQLQPSSALPSGLNLSNAEGDSISQQIAVVGSNVYVVWTDNRLFNDDIFFAASTDNGATFGDLVNLSANDGSSTLPQIAAAGDNVYVAWKDSSEGDDEIFAAVSTDNGANFSAPVNISANEGASLNPQIAASGDDVYVVWEDSTTTSGNADILIATSTNNGANFTAAVNVSANDGSSNAPQVAIAGSNIHVVWADTEEGNGDIFVAASTDNGATFSSPINISANDGSSTLPQLATAGDNVYAAWIDVTEGSEDIFVAASTDNGANFSAPVNISANEGVSFSPQIASTDGGSTVHIAWQDTSFGNADILIATSTDDGATFSAPVNVSSNDGSSLSPQLAASVGSNLFLTWSDDSVDFATSKIFLAASTDNGATFDCSINLSGRLGSSFNPDLAAALGVGYVTWTDISPGNFDVFLQAEIDPLSEIVTIDTISSTAPRWGLDAVEVSGGAANHGVNDTITIVWGDGDVTADVPISEDCTWGPVDHIYDSSSSGVNELVASLVADLDGAELASSETIAIDVQKHATSLALNPVPSVRAGSDLVVSGELIDLDAAVPITGKTVSFGGSGAANLTSTTTDVLDGSFSSTGPSPATVADFWEVSGSFEDDGSEEYFPATSETRTFSTADVDAVGFPVSSGLNSFVALTGLGFNASITFEEVLEDGEVLVSECSSPAHDRYSPGLDDRCLHISPALQLAPDSSVLVNMSFSGNVPEDVNAEDIAMFHEDMPDSIVDITQSRDLQSETVVGRTSSFSKFIAAYPVHTPKADGAYRYPIVVGDGNIVSLRDISNIENTTGTVIASFDKSKYAMTDTATLNITDSNGNVDPSIIDRISAGVMSESSDPVSVAISLVETGANTGVFLGQFGFTESISSDEDNLLQVSEDDLLSVFYISGGSLQALVDGVSESGVADLADYLVEPDVCFQPVSGAVELLFVDEHAKLGENGLISVTMSYNNSKLLGGDPSQLQLLRRVDQGVWEDITLRDEFGTSIGVDTDSMTVAGQTTGTGQFTLAFDIGCTGGAGGGFARPGAGLVVDFVASLAASRSGGGGGGSSSSSPQGDALGQLQQDLGSGSDVTSSFDLESSDGNLEITFENIVSSGDLIVQENEPAELGTLFESISPSSSQGTFSTGDGTSSQTVGNVFDILASSSLIFDGELIVTIPYNATLVNEGSNSTEDSVRLMIRNDQGIWEDRTISVDMQNNTVTGRLSSLSPVVVAIVADGTFGPMYFEENPLSKASVAELALRDTEGGNATQVMKGETVVISTSITNVQRVEQSYSYFVQVLDQNGVTVSLNSSTGSLSKAEIVKLEQSWTSALIDEPGNYTVKAYVWSQTDGSSIPIPLSEAMTQTIRVLDG